MHHYVQLPSPTYSIFNSYSDDGFDSPSPKRQKLVAPVTSVTSAPALAPTPAPEHHQKARTPAKKGAIMTPPDSVPVKSRRVRTGCLTCRERHLKCDEGTPDCLNCRKSNRECKRGVRLNFIDLTCKEPPYIPPTVDWCVNFHDESRLIASEYRGGLKQYAMYQSPIEGPPGNLQPQAMTYPQHKHPLKDNRQSMDHSAMTTSTMRAPDGTVPTDRTQYLSDMMMGTPYHQSRKSSEASYMGLPPPVSSNTAGYTNILTDPVITIKDESNRSSSHHGYKSSDASTAASIAGMTGSGPPSTIRTGPGDDGDDSIPQSGIMTPPTDNSGQHREYLNSAEEMRFMQVFVSDVAVWMDSLDKEKHFSRLIPYHALKCPMLLNALLACGVKVLTRTQQYSDDKALFYYDTATTQLLRSLQNPDRNTGECAATAVVLNVYEIMSEKPTQRMSHIAGARALIRECNWNARSDGLGAACFWLNVGMELLSCLAFNWPTSWDPVHWGVDMNFTTEKEPGKEEVWVHRIFYIVAKIANFRANIPKFQEPSPHDEQIRLQTRYAEWQQLKDMCDDWNKSCPRPMHPFGYLYPIQQSGPSVSRFPNIWLIKRASIVGRLYYHMAQCLLAQISPIRPKSSGEAVEIQQHHAHQVCGIVAHTEDRGVSSVSIRSLALVAEVLTDLDEQREVLTILERISRETGWALGGVLNSLKRAWGWEKMGGGSGSLTSQLLPSTTGGGSSGSGTHIATASTSRQNSISGVPTRLEQVQHNTTPTTTPPSLHLQQHQQQQQQQQHHHQHQQRLQQQGLATPLSLHQPPHHRSPHPHPPLHMQQPPPAPPPTTAAAAARMRVNPLSFADFSLPNHPYQNWYEPPSRSAYNSSHGFL